MQSKTTYCAIIDTADDLRYHLETKDFESAKKFIEQYDHDDCSWEIVKMEETVVAYKQTELKDIN